MALARIAFAVAVAGSVIALASNPNIKPPPSAYKSGFDSINVPELRTWLGYLAGPECEGRGTGQPGFQKAAEYMAARFKEFGLKPGGDIGTYFQNLSFFRSRTTPETTSFEVNGVKTIMKNNFTVSATKDSVLEGEVLLLVPNGENSRLEDESQVKGKIVFVLSNSSQRLRRYTTSGALAAFNVTDNPVGTPGWRVTRTRPGGEAGGPIMGTITKAAFQRMAVQLDLSIPAPDAAKADAMTIATGGRKASLTIRVQAEDVQVPNVIAVLPGSDAKLKSEVVGLGAHLDHMGVAQDGRVYWGADDDASGSAALLAVAKAFSVNKSKPKRSIVFMAFCGEEMGLIGSRYQAENPLFPLENWACQLQMDMVGRNEEHRRGDEVTEKPEDNVNTIHLVGSKRISTELHNLVLKMNEHVGFTFEYDEEDVYTRSDHYSFAQKGVPIAFLFSGFHPDYHQPTDTIEKINFDKVANTARLFYLVAATAADQPTKLKREVTGG
jgi:hypothetical protein